MLRSGWWLAVCLTLVLVAGVYTVHRSIGQRAAGDGETRVVVGELSPVALQGQQAFDRHCATCHGPRAQGSPAGPPLVHVVYRSAHHADVAFTLAVRRGVVAHHWRFGGMPALPAVSEPEIGAITRYVRELQRFNGIE
jgi:mono/diheme cytochrome c family protein